MSISLVAASKASLRATALERRDGLPITDRRAPRAAGRASAQRGFPVPFGEGPPIAGYSPLRSECDPGPLRRGLAAKGAKLALPVVDAKDKPLSFSEWNQGAQLTAGPFGILQ